MNKVFFIIFTLIHCTLCVKDIYDTQSIYLDFFHEWNPTIYDKNNKDFNTCAIVINNDPKNNNFANLIIFNCKKSMCDTIVDIMTLPKNGTLQVFCPRKYFTYFNISIVGAISLFIAMVCLIAICSDKNDNKKNTKKTAYCRAVPIL